MTVLVRAWRAFWVVVAIACLSAFIATEVYLAIWLIRVLKDV